MVEYVGMRTTPVAPRERGPGPGSESGSIYRHVDQKSAGRGDAMRPLNGIPTGSRFDHGRNRRCPVLELCALVAMGGGAPVLVPLRLDEETLRVIFERLDGLLLAGGVDVNPSNTASPGRATAVTWTPNGMRWNCAWRRWALEQDKPILEFAGEFSHSTWRPGHALSGPGCAIAGRGRSFRRTGHADEPAGPCG